MTKIKKVPVEIYSRIVGYFRPVSQWNKGKQEEFNQRKEFTINNLIINKVPRLCKSCVYYGGTCLHHSELSEKCQHYIIRPGLTHG